MTDYTAVLIEAFTEVLGEHATWDRDGKAALCDCGYLLGVGAPSVIGPRFRAHQAAQVVARLGAEQVGYLLPEDERGQAFLHTEYIAIPTPFWGDERDEPLFAFGVLTPERET